MAGGNAGYNYFKLFLATLWHLDQPTKGKANKQTKLKLKYPCLTTTQNLIFLIQIAPEPFRQCLSSFNAFAQNLAHWPLYFVHIR